MVTFRDTQARTLRIPESFGAILFGCHAFLPQNRRLNGAVMYPRDLRQRINATAIWRGVLGFASPPICEPLFDYTFEGNIGTHRIIDPEAGAVIRFAAGVKSFSGVS